MDLIVICYHYINNEQKYKGGIYPVSIERLNNQLDELGKIFKFISEIDLVNAIEGKYCLPKKSCLITFDDGLKSQFESAVPILEKRRIPAVFFINTLPLEKGEACTVHKIHFLLSKLPVEFFFGRIQKYYQEFTGQKLEVEKIFAGEIKTTNIYDKQTTFKLKHLLNSYLEPEMSKQIVNKIFEEEGKDEKEFCQKWYMSKNQLLEIRENELFSLGLHTASHLNLSVISKAKVKYEILANYNFLKKEFGIKQTKGIAFPYGIADEGDMGEKIRGLSGLIGLRYGFVARRVINKSLNQPFLLGRLDTNDVVGGKKPLINFK